MKTFEIEMRCDKCNQKHKVIIGVSIETFPIAEDNLIKVDRNEFLKELRNHI